MKPKFFYRIKDAIHGIGASWDKLAPDDSEYINCRLLETA